MHFHFHFHHLLQCLLLLSYASIKQKIKNYLLERLYVKLYILQQLQQKKNNNARIEY